MMRKENGRFHRVLIPVIALLLVLSFGGFSAEAKSGSWKKDSKGYYYQYSDGTYAKSQWLLLNGKYYRFDKNGYMLTGWQKVGKNWYYLTPSTGAMKTGWLKLKNRWYHFTSGGALQTGWQKVSGKWYHFDPDGRMDSGWKMIRGKWYFLKNGVMQTGWVKSLGKYYYLNPKSGAAATGWIKVKGLWYYLDPADLYMETGWRYIDGTRYFFDPSSGAMAVKWKKIDDYWYYFTAEGQFLTGLQSIGNAFYYFGLSGQMHQNEDMGGIRFDKNGAASNIPFEMDDGQHLYKVVIKPNGTFTGILRYAGDIGTSEESPYGYSMETITFHGSFADFAQEGNAIIMKLKAFKVDTHKSERAWYEGNVIKRAAEDYSTYDEFIKEYSVGDRFYLYLPGTYPYVIKNNAVQHTIYYRLDDSKPIETIFLDNPSCSWTYDGGAGRKTDWGELSVFFPELK